MTSTRHDELVKVIAAKIAHAYVGLPRLTTTERVELAEQTVATEIITRIGKAYADGELELPGERDRLNIAVDGCVIGVKKGDILIALSPIVHDPSTLSQPRDDTGTGTGKEEEK